LFASTGVIGVRCAGKILRRLPRSSAVLGALVASELSAGHLHTDTRRRPPLHRSNGRKLSLVGCAKGAG